MMRIVVVFPAPFGPTIPHIFPDSAAKEMESSALNVPYCLESSEMTSIDILRKMLY
jgi:hypothetical protein